ncbi:cytochrome b/b6 domain-containing protein, partial [Salmonella enterica subsp. enterica serovar Montevideo]|nr:cytochrome b/b6 domain-containing protein [Salmonella enterica subsp. enterica serovar Montevideo]
MPYRPQYASHAVLSKHTPLHELAQRIKGALYTHPLQEAPARLWHWLTVACMLVLMVTGYFIGRPLPSVSGEATYLFYMGYIR